MASEERVKVHISGDDVLSTRTNEEDGHVSHYVSGYGVVAVEQRSGRRWRHVHVFKSQDKRDRFIERVQNYGSLIDIGKDCWAEDSPVYGSPEYERLGLEAHYAWREREEDAWHGR